MKQICKDMLTTCPATALACSAALRADDDAAPDNALRDPARDVTPSGTPHCKIAGTNVHGQWRKVRSNPAARMTASQNLRSQTLGAGPRATNPRQLTPLVLRAAALDTADSVPAGAPGLAPSLDTAGSLANDATAVPLVDMIHCNNAFADAAAKTAVRSP